MKKSPNNIKRLSYQISFEPLHEIDEATSLYNQKLLQDANAGKWGIIRKLKKCVANNPDNPIYKNYLYTAYKRKRKDEEARAILDQTIAQHPDYLFGKLCLAGEYLYAEKFEEIPKILGETMELKLLYPERDVFHAAEVMTFLQIACYYFVGIKEWDHARVRLDIMRQIDPENPMVEAVEETLENALVNTNLKELITVDSYPKVDYPASKTAPILEHELLRNFYKYSTENFPADLINQIMVLPRNTLIRDLELIVEDARRRYDWFYKKNRHFVFSEQEFPVHALYFLGGLEATGSLPVILNLLRQGEDRLEYWFSDSLEEIFVEPLYVLGESQLELLREFILEPHLVATARMLISKVVAQIVFQQPRRKSEVVQWFRKVLQYHLDHPDNEGIIDTEFIQFTVLEITSVNAKELIPLFKKIWNNGWVLESQAGNLDFFIRMIKAPVDYEEKMFIPKDIHGFYSPEYPDMPSTGWDPVENKEAALNRLMRKKNKLTVETLGGMYMDEDEQETGTTGTYIARPKTGRNEPCPCGSGKKYKKCCLNK